MSERELARVRSIALTLPAVTERESHGAICFFVQGRRPLCYFHDDHRGDGRVAVWCPVASGVQDEQIAADPERFFRPPTSARGTFAGWLGIYVDTPGHSEVDWDEVSAIIKDAYRQVAPTKLKADFND